MEMNFLILFVAALVPMLIGFLWYGPLFGNAWMQEMNFTKESLAGQNMIKVFVLSYIFSLLIAFFLTFIVIHQMGVMQVLQGETGFGEKTGEAFTFFQDFLSTYGDRFRTFKHGVIHGLMSGFIFVLPIISIIAMFERKSVKYIAINSGYWIVTLAIMGGIICQWV
tara:strand:+ start:1514 stop:2011 length:498 start_codon:yes stop_codon:yes gene_type:complete